MTRQQLLAKISIDPKVCFGKPCIKGHRIWVSLILDFLAGGMTVQQILAQYPQLTDKHTPPEAKVTSITQRCASILGG